ncbi:MAG: hypothetical protein QOE31_2865 [Solirubrobacteraceae bacterium]|nr:hypothetical protein [Solirubrobacteraceae bacterium]
MSAAAAPPTVAEVARISAMSNPIVRNLEITHCYGRLSAALVQRTGSCANWCTFATWASRQAGRTIRGEDLIETLRTRLAHGPQLLHPWASLGRVILRHGLFQPDTLLGRLTAQLHTPFDVFERTSAAVARGNQKVFAEIGHEFARYLNEVPTRRRCRFDRAAGVPRRPAPTASPPTASATCARPSRATRASA